MITVLNRHYANSVGHSIINGNKIYTLNFMKTIREFSKYLTF